MSSAPAIPLLEARRVRRVYPGVVALDGADFTLRGGEVHALVGENGAGKSTLIKLLTGAERPDGGEMQLEGRRFAPRGTAAAQRSGVGAVYQEVNLVPNLTVAENLMLGHQPQRWGFVRRREMNRRARALVAEFGLQIDVTRPLASYPVAVRQLVAIARAVSLSSKVLILDEPTSSLDPGEVETLFGILRRLVQRGMGIVFIAHFLDQIYAIADRATVLRNGRVVATQVLAETPRRELIAAMLGRELAEAVALNQATATEAEGRSAIRFRQLSLGRRLKGFDLDIDAGEIVGCAGLLGSGRTETALAMFGAEAGAGEIEVDGRVARLRRPADAIRLGFGFVPEDRKADGIVGPLSVRENIVLALQAKAGPFRRIPRREQDRLVSEFMRALDIRTPAAEFPVEQLSGGNQQKVLLARWLATNPRFLILDEPTRGIDVGAHAEIVGLIGRLRERGMALYVISSELEELAAYAQRICIMRDRTMVGVLQGPVGAEQIVSAIAADPLPEAA